MTPPVADSWFRAQRLDHRTVVIDEPHLHVLFRANMFLVEGATRDMILDTGMGVVPLRPFLDTLRRDREKPIICVSTHAHVDHIGGAHEFANRLIHPVEQADLAAPGDYALTADAYGPGLGAICAAAGYPPLEGALIDALPHRGYRLEDYAQKGATATGLLHDGDTLDLGDLRFGVVHLPGHSPGQIGLFNLAEKVLFAGDAIYDGPLIFEGEGTSIPDYRATFDRLESLGPEIIHGGHDRSFGPGRMAEIIARYRAIWDQTPPDRSPGKHGQNQN